MLRAGRLLVRSALLVAPAQRRTPALIHRFGGASVRSLSAVGSPTKEDPLSAPLDTFPRRHLGSNDAEVSAMLQALGLRSLDELVQRAVPEAIRVRRPLRFEDERPRGEHELLAELRALFDQNKLLKSLIGTGYYGTITPPVILRNIIENPLWYTPYTPYQSEISQGRMESLLNFQTMISELTALPYANSSLLDEGLAAAEALYLCHTADAGHSQRPFFISQGVHPQTIAVVQTKADALGVRLLVGDHTRHDFDATPVSGLLLQYPETGGTLFDYSQVTARVHASGGLVAVATDLLALTLVKPPGEWGADIVLGSAQRFGVPLGFGGPHAAFFATANLKLLRRMPGRIMGVSRDSRGQPAIRMVLQTREQHIRRERATSNICTAQALLANTAAMYAVYHGPDGLRAIARRVHALAGRLAAGVRAAGHSVGDGLFFDTVRLRHSTLPAAALLDEARRRGFNLRQLDAHWVAVAVDETTSDADVRSLLALFGGAGDSAIGASAPDAIAASPLARSSHFLTSPVFNQYHSEHEMLRYIHRLCSKDLTLAQSMIPLGSCTMKLNATSEMIPITWPSVNSLHPFVPSDQAVGYATMIEQLRRMICCVTGFADVSFQPNSGAQGEYAGLLVIRQYHRQRQQAHRDVCLIPASAHGTNPASAHFAGFRVEIVECQPDGYISLDDLRAKAEQHREQLACLMITYPSTYGIFEERVRDACDIVHANGGQVYMDGANLNALVGLCRPIDIGADLCHLNLHKTMCIPHGGGGPGMGPIAVAEHLAPFLPGHPLVSTGGSQPIGPVAAAPWSSASILPISWVYMKLMGAAGLRRATEVAILNANYMKHRLEQHFPVRFTSKSGFVAHEFIIDLRPFKPSANIEAEDVAKRLMDYGFHSPTMSWPVPGTLMIEPTESESKAELDRFCDAMIAIRQEIGEIEDGQYAKDNNVLKGAPHTADVVSADVWERPYSRQKAAYGLPYLRQFKFWPAVGRVDNPYGDRNICTCLPASEWASGASKPAAN